MKSNDFYRQNEILNFCWWWVHFRLNSYHGHLGDGNLHLNVSAPKYVDDILAKIEPFVYEWTSRHRGSISAEHGLGLMKAEKIYYSKSSETQSDS
uniref:D-2-hydroxyglutarate dehydrogenase, mitochondrial isoform X1 n=1 Tax=Tanacetum cinerariifolium TaxID=118510 RepID=A0A699JHH5_TANCI|nr:D-2-hydroxyglutarate dehydrogenase, mitochondrial isoform X1 [Tanacetum cinerariifolium]